MAILELMSRTLRSRSIAIGSFLVGALFVVGVRAYATAPASATKLEEALDSVRPESIKADLYFIADDVLAGRDTPSVGLQVAARFVRARLERLGWKEGAPGGYFYRYKLSQKRLDERATELRWKRGETERTLHYASDYFLASGSDVEELQTSGGVVFCGQGNEDEFARAEVGGRWALCFDAGGQTRPIRERARAAGAVGLVITPAPDDPAEPYATRFAKELQRQRRGRLSYPSSSERTRAVFPQVMLPRENAAPWLDGNVLPAVGADLGVTLTEVRKLEGQGGLVDVENVCGFWPGKDPVLAQEVILVSAHYDHVGVQGGEIHNGADDNGSGTCGLLALAEALTHYGPMRRSVMLIWVSGEEKGLWGSKAWSEQPWLPDGCRAVANINIDMIGRNAPDKLLITPTKKREEDYNGLVRMAESLCSLEGFPSLGSADQYYTRSDQANFAKLGIPVTFLFSDVHEDYHQPGDDPEKIDYDKVRRVVRLVMRMLDGLQEGAIER